MCNFNGASPFALTPGGEKAETSTLRACTHLLASRNRSLVFSTSRSPTGSSLCLWANSVSSSRTLPQSVGCTSLLRLGILASPSWDSRRKLRWACSTSSSCVFASIINVISCSSLQICNRAVAWEPQEEFERADRADRARLGDASSGRVGTTPPGSTSCWSLDSESSRNATKWCAFPNKWGTFTWNRSTPTRTLPRVKDTRRQGGAAVSGWLGSLMKLWKGSCSSAASSCSNFWPLKSCRVISKVFKPWCRTSLVSIIVISCQYASIMHYLFIAITIIIIYRSAIAIVTYPPQQKGCSSSPFRNSRPCRWRWSCCPAKLLHRRLPATSCESCWPSIPSPIAWRCVSAQRFPTNNSQIKSWRKHSCWLVRLDKVSWDHVARLLWLAAKLSQARRGCWSWCLQRDMRSQSGRPSVRPWRPQFGYHSDPSAWKLPAERSCWCSRASILGGAHDASM